MRISLSERKSGMSPAKRLLLEKRLRGEHSTASRTFPIAPLPRPEILPLSFAQGRLWFLYRLEGSSPTYNVPLALRLNGKLDRIALEEALGDLVERHESLRTLYPESLGTPRQEVLATAAVVAPRLALEAIAPSALAERLAAASTERGFHLETELPLRAYLFALSQSEHVLLLVAHHIAADGASVMLLANDLATAYAARLRAKPPAWPKLAVQYGDYSLWQQQMLGSEDDPGSFGARQIAFWLETLKDLPEQLRLPVDRPRPAHSSYRGGNVALHLSAALHHGLSALARDCQASVFMVLQAALAALLCRLGAGDDIPLGSPISGRTDIALEKVVGFFVNTVVLRTCVSGNPAFRDLVGRVRKTDLDVFAHQELPFDRLVEVLNPTRSLARNPLFQVLLAWQDASQTSLEFPGLTAAIEPIGSTVAKFDLSFNFSEQRALDGAPQGIDCMIEYSADLFNRDTVQSMAVRLETLLRAVAANADQAIEKIDLLSEKERIQVTAEWNATACNMPQAALHTLFEAQVKLTPEAPALIFEDATLCYRELNERANRLAHRLIAHGISAESIVGVALPRSLEMVISLLGILKSGAAYLPLDPEYPAERLRWMLEDSGVSLVLTLSHLRGALPDIGARILALDEEWDELARQSPDDPGLHLPLGHLAYVIYTSGSTGRPKGAMNTHQGISNRVLWMQAQYRLKPEDRVLQKTSFSFDVSVWEFFWPLVTGACLVVAKPGGHRDPEYLAQVMIDRQITTVHFVPSALAAFLQTGKASHCDSLRRVICSGEALSPDLAKEFFSQLGCELHNLYGPTEASVDVLYWQCVNGNIGPTVPIGRPIWNTQVYVLDQSLQVSPIGVEGELYLAGAGLARGYLKRPGLTAERFLADPFGAPGERIYRTGDLARWRTDGQLEFLGRADQQVKIRGFRVEPGEIEAALLSHPEVGQAAVIISGNQAGEQQIVGYVVPAAGQSADPAALRQSLAQTLPEYMVPAALVMLKAFPLNPNGKLDRKALPAADFAAGIKVLKGPRTPQEEILCSLFSEILGVPGVGIQSNFFEMGGHSLLGARLVSRIRAALGVELSIRDLFETPTVAGLAKGLAKAQAARPALRPMNRPEEIPLSFAQRRLWFFYRLEGPGPTYNIPAALRLSGSLDRSALELALGDLVERHESLRTVFPEKSGVPRQHILPGDGIHLPLGVEAVTEEALPGRLAASVMERGFDLMTELPLRARLFALGQNEHVLLLIIHHIAGDAWSMGPLMEDLAQAYSARCRQQLPGWRKLPVQYADYTLWQQQLFGSEDDPTSPGSLQMKYWTKTLENLPERLELPADYPRPARPSYNGNTVLLHFGPSLHRSLLALARREQASLFMVLQAAVGALLSRMGAGHDIPIGSPIAGRTDEAVEDLVGFFVNTLVLRADTSGNPSFLQLLARVRATDLNAYAHQDLPFERLVEALNPSRTLSHHPLFQVMMVFQQNQAGRGLPEMTGLTTQFESIGSRVAKFDLLFGLEERFARDGAPEGIEGAIEYSTDLFDGKTVAALGARLLRLLEAVAADPAQLIGSLELLGEDERHQVLVAWNNTARAVPHLPFSVLFEAQVERTPDATAVIFENDALSYRELNRRANLVAHALIARGIGPEDIVAVVLPRSLEMMAGILGILKSGAAYLPIDPEYPLARLAFLLDDAQPECVLTAGAVCSRLPAGAPRLVLDDANTRLALDRGSCVNPTDSDRIQPLAPQNPAYLIYTSGSTGTPKGVVVTHGGISSLSAVQIQEFGLTSQARVLQFSSLGFDAMFWELCMSLLSGAALVMAPAERILPGASLTALVAAHGVTHLTIPPAALAVVPEDGLPGCSTIVVAGEACSEKLVAQWSTGRRMINAYGPTETTVCATISSSLAPSRAPGIGRPIWNTSVYVLDELLQPVPVGVSGELYIAGASLARGYWKRPGLTAERFVANPYAQDGKRMYRTGDLGQWNAEGDLKFLGRADQQVKIRGFRVELGEIESALLRHPDVAQVTVVAREDQPGEKQLVGYVVPAPGHAADPAGLRQHLALTLPDHMVPAAFVILESLPVTPNGKLDRNALPAPDFNAAATSWRGPRTPQEQILCSLFAEVCCCGPVGIHDNFFDLGGHSLLAARLIGRIRATLGMELSIGALFEHPTVAGLAQLLDSAQMARPALHPMPRPNELPLSFAQQRLWFLYRLEGPSPTYNIPIGLRFTGHLNRAALQAALGDLLERHETLRTVFPESSGLARQHILPAHQAGPPLRLEAIAEDVLAGKLAAAAGAGFELETEVPLRAHLFALNESDHVLLLVLHHIASDGWSVAPLLADLARAYAARCLESPPDWTQLPVQYADYTLWQQQMLGDESDPQSLAFRQMAFWSNALKGLPERLDLPIDHARPLAPTYRGRIEPLQMDAKLHRRLASLARANEATLFMVMQAAIAALLSRMGVGSDVPIGSPIAGRSENALENLVGFFVNTMVLRTNTSGNPSFRELLARVRTANLNAYAHQDLPFERLVESLNPVRSLVHQPLFQVMLVLQNMPEAHLEFSGLTTSLEPVGVGIAKFDLSFSLRERFAKNGTPEGIEGVIEYSTDLFESSTIQMLATRLVRLLHAVVAEPSRSIGHLDLLAREERQRILVDWNDTAHSVSKSSVSALFEAQADKTPDAVAVISGDRQLTYAELNGRANQLAHYLRELGVTLETRVALFMERSVEMVAGLLGVLKAGGAYVPLDPKYPAERLAYILEDSHAPVVLTESHLRRRLPDSSARVVVLDDDRIRIQKYGRENLAVVVNDRNAAYLIYTSGSTGQPKGMVIEHRNISRLVCNTNFIQLSGSDRVAHVSNISFDAATFEVWGPLLNGGSIVLIPFDLAIEPQRFAAELAAQRITALFITTALFNQMVSQAPWALGAVRNVLFGGEAVDLERVQRLMSEHPPERLLHVYGPTETTTFATWHQVGDLAKFHTVPIGKPITTTRTYVLDENLEPVPAGITGELYVAGDGLGRGYLQKPDMTASRFLADPIGPPGARMYRTGDLVRWSVDGNLEFLGRTDHQVKIRGFRVELGEIETALLRRAEVAQATVMVREDQRGEKRLVGYVVPANGHTADTVSLTRQLALSLPEHMVPSALVVLDSLPLTLNGKLDRKALPDPDFNAKAKTGRGPRTPQEEILCSLFAEIVGVARVGIHDNFFELGGHSLLATRLISRIRATLGVELSIRSLFETPTVAGLAEGLGQAQMARPALLPAERPEEIPLSFSQHRLWFLHRMEGPSPTYNIPVAMRLTGMLDRAAMEAALSDLVERHETLRTVFPEVGGVPRQQVLDAACTRPLLRLEVVTEDVLAERLASAIGVGFELTQEIPLRAHLFVLAENLHVLLLIIHHIAGDGWSIAPLLSDLTHAYDARCKWEQPDWPKLPVQYADYTLWQQQVLGSESDPESLMARQLKFWMKTLEHLPEQLGLPVDRPHPARVSYRGGTVPLHFDVLLHQRLATLARESEASLFMVLQAGVAALLSQMGAGNDISIGSPIAGRNDRAVEDLVGFFVNTLVLRTDTSGNPSFRELLARVRTLDLNAYAHQELPFERLVESLNPVRSLAHHPIFQVMLLFQNALEANLELAGLTVAVEPIGSAVAKFDLTFSMGERRAKDGAPEGMEGLIEYNADVFDRATIERLATRLKRLLEEVAANPSLPIEQLDLLGEDERRQLLEWNDTAHVVPDVLLPALLEAQVERSPDAPAVIFEGTTLNYRELNERANRVAHKLIAEGIGPEDFVAVALPRSLEMVVGLLGILKSGAAYVPLDPDYPIDRLAFILGEVRPVCVLTTTALAPHLPATAPFLLMDDPGTMRMLAQWPGANPKTAERTRHLVPQHPAYAIYTSGSTGKPKGIVITHGGLRNFLSAMREKFPLDRQDQFLAVTTISFDIAVLEIFLPLLSGARLRIALRETIVDALALAEMVRKTGATMMQATPTLWQTLVTHDAEKLADLKMLVGGEGLPIKLSLALQSAGRELTNLYGPTETTVWATAALLDSRDSALSPIGRPIWNTCVYILDQNLRLRPVGVPGELYITGEGLARGYLKRPGLTAERYVPDVFGAPGSRMYRTGDLARWRKEGTLEFLGRTDHQVKIRGFRIEIEEIEAALCGHPDVSQAKVMAREDRPGEKYLAGYVVAAAGHKADAGNLRSHLAQSLPDYMVPAVFVVLDSLPLMPNGKLDRKALPPPEFAAGPHGWLGPRTPQEEILCSLFAEILGITRVGVQDNFFESGGHSLLATRLISRIRATLGVELSIRSLFEAPTVAELTGRLGGDTTEDQLEVMLPLRPQGSLPPLFCIHPGSGLSWCYAGLLRHVRDCPIYGLQARGITQADMLPQTLEEMALDYLSRIRKVQPSGPYYLLGWSLGGLVAYSIATSLQEQGEQVALLGLLDAYPAGPSAAMESPDEQQILGAAFQALGYDVGESPLEISKLRELLRQDGHSLASLEDRHFAAMIEVNKDNARLRRNFIPQPFHGNVLLFTATHDLDEESSGPEIWRRYIHGQIKTCPIACRHEHMMQAGPLAEIGHVLAGELANVSPSKLLHSLPADSLNQPLCSG
jgi:amino acid adenylation domain-containing protein